MPTVSSERPLAEPNKVERRDQELTNCFEVVMEFPNPNGELKEGMTGTARIYVPSGFWREANYAFLHTEPKLCPKLIS
jgi:hypothetical protein